MIRSFKCGETEKIWHGQYSAAFPGDLQGRARMKLRMLSNAQNINDLRSPPGNRLERLKGDRAGQWSIRVNDQWRLCFLWSDGNAFGVEIVDYH